MSYQLKVRKPDDLMNWNGYSNGKWVDNISFKEFAEEYYDKRKDYSDEEMLLIEKYANTELNGINIIFEVSGECSPLFTGFTLDSLTQSQWRWWVNIRNSSDKGDYDEHSEPGVRWDHWFCGEAFDVVKQIDRTIHRDDIESATGPANSESIRRSL